MMVLCILKASYSCNYVQDFIKKILPEKFIYFALKNNVLLNMYEPLSLQYMNHYAKTLWNITPFTLAITHIVIFCLFIVPQMTGDHTIQKYIYTFQESINNPSSNFQGQLISASFALPIAEI